MTIGKKKRKPRPIEMDDKMFNNTCREDRRQTTCTCNTSQQIVVLREYLRNKVRVFVNVAE